MGEWRYFSITWTKRKWYSGRPVSDVVYYVYLLGCTFTVCLWKSTPFHILSHRWIRQPNSVGFRQQVCPYLVRWTCVCFIQSEAFTAIEFNKPSLFYKAAPWWRENRRFLKLRFPYRSATWSAASARTFYWGVCELVSKINFSFI